MLQKMWAAIKTKAFIFNAVTILICAATALIIPKLVKEINTAANTGDPALNAPADEGTETNPDKTNTPKQLDTVTGEPADGMKITAVLLDAPGGKKFWKLTVNNVNTDEQIKSWDDIYAEWEADPTVLDFDKEKLTVRSGGLQYTAEGGRGVTVRYKDLSVQLGITAPSLG